MNNRKDIIESLQWAIGMAEEAIMTRESGDDPEDTKEVLQMHRDSMQQARSVLDSLTASPKPPVSLLPHDVVESFGYAKFNGYQHLCVDVPNGGFTISAKTSEGKRVTFSFLPYKNDGPAQCVDVCYFDNGTSRQRNEQTLPTFDMIAFGGPFGSDLYNSRSAAGEAKPGLITVLMESR